MMGRSSSVVSTLHSPLQAHRPTPPNTHTYTRSRTHRTQCHPTPSCFNASNPLCGRVTSATVRNRVKLNRHQEEGAEGGREAPADKQTSLLGLRWDAALRGGDLLIVFPPGGGCPRAPSREQAQVETASSTGRLSEGPRGDETPRMSADKVEYKPPRKGPLAL